MKKRNNIQLILLILVIALGIGYAYINSDLNINGTATINNASWDVHWANVQVANGSVSASTPTIANGTTVNYSVTLNNPGDYYEFTVDAVNAGTIDAMIDTMNSKLNGVTITTLPDYLNYTITYSDGEELQQNQELLANTIETYKVRLEYSTDIELEQIPTTNQTLNLQFTVTYRQTTSDSEPVRNYLYRSNTNNVNIGDGPTALGTTYTTYQDLVSTTGHNSFLRHRIKNNQVVQSDVGFVYNNNVYYLIGGGATYDSSTGIYNSDSIYYETNQATLQTAFGSSNCSVNGDNHSYTCSVSSFYAFTSDDGNVYINALPWTCVSAEDGYSFCGSMN